MVNAGMESYIDTVAGAKHITVCGVQAAYHQIPVTTEGTLETAFATRKGEWVFLKTSFWHRQRSLYVSTYNDTRFCSLLFRSLVSLYMCMGDLIYCSSTWEGHTTLPEDSY